MGFHDNDEDIPSNDAKSTSVEEQAVSLDHAAASEKTPKGLAPIYSDIISGATSKTNPKKSFRIDSDEYQDSISNLADAKSNTMDGDNLKKNALGVSIPAPSDVPSEGLVSVPFDPKPPTKSAGGDSPRKGAVADSSKAADEEEKVLTEEEKYAIMCEELCPRALFFLTLDNPFRKRVVKIVKSKTFDRTILLLILLNCVFLAMDSNEPHFAETGLGKLLAVMEYVFTVAFFIEMMLKITGLGFVVGEGTYLRDGWNCMDCGVVVLGILASLPNGVLPSVSALRTVRVLRPLRTITGVEGMRKLVVTLLQSLPMLMDVLVLVSFAFFIFGIVGVQLFAEKMRYRCMLPAEPAYEVDLNTLDVIYDLSLTQDTVEWEIPDEDEENTLCSRPLSSTFPSYSSTSNGGRVCKDYPVEVALDDLGLPIEANVHMWCHKYSNPNNGITSFDNILWAWLTIFQCISLEGWVDVMYYVQDGVNDWVWIYFTVMIVFGSFFAVNLALAVLYVKFTEEGDDEGEEGTNAEEGEKGADGAEDANDAVPVTSWQDSAIVLWCYNLQARPSFEFTTMGLIVLNTVTMASEYHGSPQAMNTALEWINYILTAYFALEMVVKLIGLGFVGYCRDRMNIFDGLVVIFSLLEVILNAVSGGSGSSSLSVLRSFRLLRVFKLARSWKQLNEIIRTIFDSLSSISYLSLILLLFIFIAALLGMQLFGYRLEFCDGFPDGARSLCPNGEKNYCPKHYDCYVDCPMDRNNTWMTDLEGLCVEYPLWRDGVKPELKADEEVQYMVRVGKSYVPRHNFDDIFWSIITIFQILTGENWNAVMYDGIRATTEFAAFYFLLLVVVGNYIILNLFLAILLDNFGSGSSSSSDSEEEDDEDLGEDEPEPIAEPPANATPEQLQRTASQIAAQKKLRASMLRRNSMAKLNKNSLGFLGPENPLRVYLHKVVSHKKFEWFIVALICISSMILAIDSPNLDPNGKLKEVLDILDKIFVVLFGLEMILKVTAFGFLFHEGAYLRQTWNQLDFFIVWVGVIGWVGVGGGNLTALRALRTFRALRPIRMASRAEGMKVVVNALFQSIPGIANVAFVCLLFYIIFGILGLNLFMGKYYFCENTISGEKIDANSLFDPQVIPGTEIDMSYKADPITKAWCEAGSAELGGRTIDYPDPSLRPSQYIETQWVNPTDYNFDNIFASIFTLFEMATLEGWLDVMYDGVDATLEDQHPERDHDKWICVFFLLFIVVGSFFVMNLFVGVTIDKFNEMKEKQEGRSVFLTDEQRAWVSIQKLMVGVKPLRMYIVPENEFRRILFDFVNNDQFDAFIMGMILLNVIVMSMTHADMTTAWTDALFYANTAFAIVFLIEAIFKLIALFPRQYFNDNWNNFDFVVVLLSLVSIFVTLTMKGTNIPGLNLLRVFRVTRIFRLIPKAKGLRTLFQTLVVSLPALGNVGSVLFLFFFIFAVMGMNLFGKIKFQDFLSRHANFRDFTSALMVLFRMSTGESWNGIMHDCMISQECWYVNKPGSPYYGMYFSDGADELDGLSESYDDGKENRCSPDPYGMAAVLFFCVFVIICAFVMLNLVIAVILENFQKSSESEAATVGRDHMQRFQDVWSRLDPYSTYYISAGKLTTVVAELDTPLGTRGAEHCTKTDIQNIIMSVDIPNHNGKVHFYETLHALAGRVAGLPLPEDEEVKIRGKIKDKLPTFTSEALIPKYTAAHYHAALYVQAAVRGFLARYHMRAKIAEQTVSDVPLLADSVEKGGQNSNKAKVGGESASTVPAPPQIDGSGGGAVSQPAEKVEADTKGTQPPGNHNDFNHSAGGN